MAMTIKLSQDELNIKERPPVFSDEGPAKNAKKEIMHGLTFFSAGTKRNSELEIDKILKATKREDLGLVGDKSVDVEPVRPGKKGS